MGKFYNLYLDETKYNKDGKFMYGIAGMAVPFNKVRNMGRMLGKLKKEIWSDLSYTETKKIILHMSDIRSANIKFDSNYLVFSARSMKRKVFEGIGDILVENDCVVFGTMVNLTSLEQKYCSKSTYYIGDSICMMNIINNFVCFLKHQNAKGNIIF